MPNEVPYDDYLKKRVPIPRDLTGEAGNIGVSVFASRLFPQALVLYGHPTLENTISAFYESLMEIYGERWSEMKSVTPDQLHYHLTETEGLVTFLGNADQILSTVISKQEFRISLPANQMRQVKNAFSSIPDYVEWKSSLRARPKTVETKDLLGIHLQAWRKA